MAPLTAIGYLYYIFDDLIRVRWRGKYQIFCPYLGILRSGILFFADYKDNLRRLFSQMELVVKNPPINAGLIPGLRRFPGGGHGNPLQYFA